MLSSFFNKIPAEESGTTGIISHAYYWLTTLASDDIVYKNPYFKAVDKDGSMRDGIVIYCIHGMADQPGSFVRIAERLIAKGLPENISAIHLVSFDKRYRGKGIRYFSQYLVDKIKSNGHTEVVFVGHSRGGVVAAEATEYRAEKEGINVHFTFSICAPFGGSHLACQPLSSLSTSVEQLEINSKFLYELNKKISASSKVYYFAYAGEDCVVDPAASLVHRYVKKHSKSLLAFDYHGHISIMSSHRLVDIIRQRLFNLQNNLGENSSNSTNALGKKSRH